MTKINRRQLLLGAAILSGGLPVLSAFGPVPSAGRDEHGSDSQTLPGELSARASEKQVDDLLNRMTLDEKVRQLCSLRIPLRADQAADGKGYNVQKMRKDFDSAGIGFISRSVSDLDPEAGTELTNLIQRVAAENTRLRIPPIIDGEGLRGLRANGSCVFPVSIAMGATWNPALIHKVAVTVGQEARSRGVHRIFAPVLNLARDPRHGRTEETYGEDPYLASRLGVAFVTGLQSQGIIATPKHFVANFEADGGRDSGDIELSERILRELYFVPFKAAIVEGGALGLMCAYNSLNGVPCALNAWLLTEILRGEWNFQGAVVSDWGAIGDAIHDLHATASPGEAARQALLAGTDVESPRLDVYNSTLADEVKAGRLKQEILDESVRRVLRLKFGLGLFDKRYNDANQAAVIADTDVSRDIARQVARESIVLLKNNRSVLPLKPSLRSIAVIGPNADRVQMGGYAPDVFEAISPLKALQNHFGKAVSIRYAQGCELLGDNTDAFREAVSAAKESEIAVLFVGGSSETAGETKDRADLDLTGKQQALIETLSTLGKQIVVVIISGGPVTMTRWIDKVDAVLMAWYGGEEGGNAIVDILTGAINPSGHLPVTFPRFTGQLPMPYNHRPYGRSGSVLEVPSVNDNVRYSPLFPFAYGLSYTTFLYSDLAVVPGQISREGTVRISVTVANTGSRSGGDVVQVYLSSASCRISQPVQRLCAFRRIFLDAGAKEEVTLILGSEQLAFLNEQFKPEVNLGSYSILVGNSSQDGLRASFEVVAVGYGDPYS